PLLLARNFTRASVCPRLASKNSGSDSGAPDILLALLASSFAAPLLPEPPNRELPLSTRFANFPITLLFALKLDPCTDKGADLCQLWNVPPATSASELAASSATEIFQRFARPVSVPFVAEASACLSGFTACSVGVWLSPQGSIGASSSISVPESACRGNCQFRGTISSQRKNARSPRVPQTAVGHAFRNGAAKF